MWAREAEPEQIAPAYAEEEYTLRELVAAFHGAAADHPQVAESVQVGWRDCDRVGGGRRSGAA